jgi:hypothetical protein
MGGNHRTSRGAETGKMLGMSIDEPPDDARIWRHMEVAKLLSLLTTEQLFHEGGYV